MKKILILNVDASPVAGAEKYLPEPAMGNQKPGTPEYQAKWQEKRNKQLQELQSHSFLSEPISIQFAMATTDGAGFDLGKVVSVGAVKDLFEALNAPVDFIAGPHPTTHSRIIINTAIRAGMQIPLTLVHRPRVNPWQFIATQAEGEYPLSWVALGKKPVNPIEDTFQLLKALGPGILMSKE
jgi:hypothetical protein